MNPEFQRNLWQEWTRPRLTSAFAALGAILVLAWLANGRLPGAITANAALGCIAIFTVAWGAHLCGRSLIDELRSRTWDQQRMSALSPWRMLWGKLLGAPAVAWACGGVAAGVYLLSVAPGSEALWMLLALTAGAVACHAGALIGGLTLAQRGQPAGMSVSLRLAATLGLYAVGSALFKSVEGVQHWYGFDFPSLAFSACVLAALAGWLVFGSYRLMCDELKVRTRPWALGGFIGFVAVLYAGWLYGPNTTPLAWVTQICTLGFCGALLAAYVCAMAFGTDPLMPRRLLGYAARGLWRRVAEEAPLWTVAAAYALPLAVLAGVLGGGQLAIEKTVVHLTGGGALALLLYATRDLAVLFGIACRAPLHGVETSQLIYLALAYWLLPSIASLAGGETLSLLLRPDPERALSAVAVLCAHALLALWWARQMWEQRLGEQGTQN